MPRSDEPGLEAIYGRVRRRVLRLLGHQDGVEDIVQTAMESFVRASREDRVERSQEAYIDTIATNAVYSWLRRKRRRSLLQEMVAVHERWPEITSCPEKEVENWDRFRRLVEIIEKLKPAHRIAYMYFHVENRSVPDIARLEGTSESAIRTRILRARREIHRRALGDPVLSEWLRETGSGESEP